MLFDPSRVRAVTLDSFSTLVDPRSAARVLESIVDDPETVAREWHARAVQYATVATPIGAYEPYLSLYRYALEDLLRERSVPVEDLDRDLDRLTAVYHDLDPFDDVESAIRRLDGAGYRVAILSNGDPDMLSSMVGVIDGAGAIEMTISASEVLVFKPHEALYRHAADRLDVPIGTIAHAGAGWGDVVGCMHAGMQGVWVDRYDDPWPSFGPSPDHAVTSLDALADLLIE